MTQYETGQNNRINRTPIRRGAGYASVPRDCVARNRGADFVQCLAPALCAGTRHWTRLRSSDVRRQACCHPPCSRVSAALGKDAKAEWAD